jgi:hypothetical protein
MCGACGAFAIGRWIDRETPGQLGGRSRRASNGANVYEAFASLFLRQDAIRLGLRDLGHMEAQNIRPAEQADGFAGLAVDLVSLDVDLIVARGSQAVLVARQQPRSFRAEMASKFPLPGARTFKD